MGCGVSVYCDPESSCRSAVYGEFGFSSGVKASEMRNKYLIDGSLPAGCTSDQLMFRVMLDHPVAIVCLQAHMEKHSMEESYACLVDLLDFKRADGASKRAKSIAIYMAHFEQGSLLREDERQEIEDLFAPLLQLSSEEQSTVMGSVSLSSFRLQRSGSRSSIQESRSRSRQIRPKVPSISSGNSATTASHSSLRKSTGGQNPDAAALAAESSASRVRLTAAFDCLLLRLFVTLHDTVFAPLLASPEFGSFQRAVAAASRPVIPADFECVGVIGGGGYGVVVHAVKKSTGAHIAVKLLHKDQQSRARSTNGQCPAVVEKRVLAACQHPFIVKLLYAFHDENMVMLGLSLGTAGDLSSHLRASPGSRFGLKRTTFYVTEIVCVLSYLHSKGIIYRDLKPGNILLLANGHIQLTDFGTVVDTTQSAHVPAAYTTRRRALKAAKSAKVSSQRVSRLMGSSSASVGDPEDGVLAPVSAPVSLGGSRVCAATVADLPRAMTIVGTVGYMAPEIVLMRTQTPEEMLGYTKAVDWWSLGVCMYRMLAGRRPFKDKAMSDDVPSQLRPPEHSPVNHEHAEMSLLLSQYLLLFGTVDYSQLLGDSYGDGDSDGDEAAVELGTADAGNTAQQLKQSDQLDASAPLREARRERREKQMVLAVDLIASLLSTVEEVRLGYGEFGTANVQGHSFFHSVDWSRVDAAVEEPPCVPTPVIDIHAPRPIRSNAGRNYDCCECGKSCPHRCSLCCFCRPFPTSQSGRKVVASRDGVASFEDAVVQAGREKWLLRRRSTRASVDANGAPFWKDWAYASPAAYRAEYDAAMERLTPPGRKRTVNSIK